MKQTLAIVLVVSLLCILASGTTIAYLTTSDFGASAIPVGKVEISQNKDLLAVSAGSTVEQSVPVTLSSDSAAAYIRTIFAFEVVEGFDPVKHVEWGDPSLLQAVMQGDKSLTVTIDEKEYILYIYTYNAPLSPGTTTATPCTLKITLDSSVTSGVEVLILSQAVPAAGYTDVTHAFPSAFPVDSQNPDSTYTAWFQSNKS